MESLRKASNFIFACVKSTWSPNLFICDMSVSSRSGNPTLFNKVCARCGLLRLITLMKSLLKLTANAVPWKEFVTTYRALVNSQRNWAGPQNGMLMSTPGKRLAVLVIMATFHPVLSAIFRAYSTHSDISSM